MADWFASPTGSPENDGTFVSAWDLESALLNTTDIEPGDTLWLLEGTYMHPNRGASTFGYKVGLQGGSSGAYITVRPYEGKRVTIDGGLHSTNVAPIPQHVIIRDLEVLVSENLTMSRVSDTEGSTPTYAELNRPWGGIDMQWGSDIKVINCVIHDNAQGMGLWVNLTDDCEFYGNIIYDNGWLNPSGAPHGHGIYTQNIDTTRKYFFNNILLQNYFFNLHAYGSGASHVENCTVEDNISAGGPRGQEGTIRNFMLGNENSSSNYGHEVRRNRLFHSNLRIGYNQPADSVTLEDNHVILSQYEILAGSTNISDTGKFHWGETGHGTTCNLQGSPSDGAPTPQGPEVFVTPNTYDSNRAHIAVFNYFLDANVAIDPSPFLTSGNDFYLLDPMDFYGQPVFQGTYQGAPVDVPVGSMFKSFVLMKGTFSEQTEEGTSALMDPIKKGSVDQTLYLVLKNATTGAPATGLTLTDIDLSYTRNRSAHVKNDAGALASADAAHSDNGAFEVDSTNAPGLYRTDWPDAAFASGVDKVILSVAAAGVDPAHFVVKLADVDSADLNARLMDSTAAAGFNEAANCITYGTVAAGSSTSVINIDSIAPTLQHVNQVRDQVIKFRSDTLTQELRGQASVIESSTTTTLTVSPPLTASPQNGDKFSIG